jgi:hypothetical protein
MANSTDETPVVQYYLDDLEVGQRFTSGAYQN